MKRILVVLFALVTFSATAQDFKPFKVNVSLGFAKPLTGSASGGFLLAVEPKYGLSDNFDVGVRLESAFVARSVERNGTTTTGDIAGLNSALLTGNYLISTGTFRPFIGAGVGIFSVSSGGTVSVTDGQTPQDVTFVSETKFGGMVRAGFKTGHFVLSVEYNAVPTSTVSTISASSLKLDSKNSYLGIKLGVDLGGGRN